MIRTIHAESQTKQPDEAPHPHVLLILDGFPKALGGGERIALRMAALLPAYGYKVSILTFAIDPESPVLAEAPCPVYLLPLRRTYDLTAFRAAWALRRFLREQNIVLAQTFFESSDLWAGLIVKRFSRARLVWSRRDMGILRGRKHQIAYRRLAGLPDAVFAVSGEVRRHCIEVDGIAADRVQTIPNGIELAHWEDTARTGKCRGPLRLVTVGNIRRVKGHDLLLLAFKRLLRVFPDCSLTIAGAVLEPDYFAELRQTVSSAGIKAKVHFAGSVPDPRPLLAAADLFVLPSRSEGFSNVVLEAMASGLPVVATAVGGNAEAVEDQQTGLIVPVEDVEALGSALERLVGDESLRNRMGIAGALRVSRFFTTQAMMQSTVDAYSRLLRNPSART